MGNAARSTRKAGAISAAALIFVSLQATAAFACPMPGDLRATALDRHFSEEKFISGMSKPLLSEGRLTASKNEVVWHMTSPFDVRTVITSSGIMQAVDGGEATAVGPGASEIGAGIAKSIAALMRGQWSELKTMFDVALPLAPADGDWQVVLRPLDSRLQSMLGTITVRGCEDVSSVEIARDSGDREMIRFSDAATKAP